jgi:phage gpG-like protein
MAGFSFGMSIDSKDSMRILLAMSERIRNDRLAYHKKVANIARRGFRQNFAVGGQPAWQPLRPETIATKANIAQFPAVLGKKSGRIPVRLKQNGNFGPSSILIATGALRDSVGSTASPHNVSDFRKDGMELGTDLIYAPTHNYGAVIVPRRVKFLRWWGSDGRPIFARQSVIPARPFLTLTDPYIEEIAKAGADWLASGVTTVTE